jgi:hypothetical protein
VNYTFYKIGKALIEHPDHNQPKLISRKTHWWGKIPEALAITPDFRTTSGRNKENTTCSTRCILNDGLTGTYDKTS